MDLQNQFKPGKSQAFAYFPGAEKQCWTASFPASVAAAYGIGTILLEKVSSAGLETVLQQKANSFLLTSVESTD